MSVLNGYCYNGQHRACSGTAWTSGAAERQPQLTRCSCPCHAAGAIIKTRTTALTEHAGPVIGNGWWRCRCGHQYARVAGVKDLRKIEAQHAAHQAESLHGDDGPGSP